MNTNPVSTRIKADDRRLMAVEETGPSSVPEAPPPESPDVASRNDFASSAAMVNDILAARPTGDTKGAAVTPAEGDSGVAQGSGPTGIHPSGIAASSDFFASAKSKKPAKTSSKKASEKATRKPFWQMQLTLRRSRTGER